MFRGHYVPCDMSTFAWEELAGLPIPGGYVLTKLIEKTLTSALFRATSSEDSKRREVVVEVSKPLEPAQTAVNRFLEASFLEHPNLTRIMDAGLLETHGLVCAVGEPIDHTLTQFVTQRPLPVDDAIELTDQLISGLSYLHSENLVFCNLRPESVWRTGTTWKLGDFSQLRVIGRGDSRDLRTALSRRPDLPPEVYEGVVSPAWDVWSLGLLLRRVLMPEPAHVEGALSIPRGRQLRNAELPPPFDTITRDCLEPNLDARITLDQIRLRLRPEAKAVLPAAVPHPTSRPVHDEQQDSLKSRIVSFFRRLPNQKPPMQAGLALAGAAIIMGILATANALVRHDNSPARPSVAPVVEGVSDADRSIQRSVPATTPTQQTVRPGSRETVAGDSAPSAADNSAPSDDIKTLLDKWVSSTRSHDVRANVDCYAPVVDSFFGRQAVSRDQLAREKQRQFQTIGRVRKFGLENVRVNRIGRDRAIVSFDKEWSFGDRNPFSGAERAELTIRNLDGAWKIIGEKEVKIYWVRHGDSRELSRH